ncbi:MAG: NDP-sugar synthase [Thermoprotei archaeon]|nr:MAG: NDP-sugar synthase [Thermoprotei archaeon]
MGFMVRTAVILAGGKGTRLRPLTLSLPKPLVPVGNLPLLHHILKLLENDGFEKVIVIVNYMGDKIREYISKIGHSLELEIRIPNINSLDTADGVRKCGSLIDEDFIVIMGDILTNIDLSSFIKFHEKRGGIASIALVETDNPLGYGVVVLSDDSKISLFLEKPHSVELYLMRFMYSKHRLPRAFYANLVNTGIYAFKREILDILDDNPELMDWGRHVFPYLVENNYTINGWIAQGYWKDIGVLKQYLEANIDLLNSEVRPLKPLGHKENGIWLDDGVVIEKGAKIIPPIAVGKDVLIEKGAVVGPYAILGNKCYVGKGAKIANSVAWDCVGIGKDALVKGAILASNVKLGENVRIDEEVVIGEGVFINSNMLIERGKIIYPLRKVLGVKVIR